MHSFICLVIIYYSIKILLFKILTTIILLKILLLFSISQDFRITKAKFVLQVFFQNS